MKDEAIFIPILIQFIYLKINLNINYINSFIFTTRHNILLSFYILDIYRFIKVFLLK